jgi:hypothetical protein
MAANFIVARDARRLWQLPAVRKLAALLPSSIDLAEVTRFVSGCAMNFPSNADALAELRTQRAV